LSQDYGNARYTMAKCTHVLRTHKLAIHNKHDSKWSRYRIQNNCSMCPPFTRTTAFSLSRHWSMDLLMICWSRLSHQVCTLSLRSSRSEIGMRYVLCCRAPQTAQSTGFKSGLMGGHTDGSMKFGTVRCRNSTVDFDRWDSAPSCWNTKWSSYFWWMSGRRHRCSLQHSFAVVTCIYLGFWTILKTECCHAFLCIASLCVLRTCVHFAIVYRAWP